jgi:hypothetical protein
MQFVLFAKPTGEHTWELLEVWMAIFFMTTAYIHEIYATVSVTCSLKVRSH